MLESEESKHPKRVINNYVGLWRKTLKKNGIKKIKTTIGFTSVQSIFGENIKCLQ